MLLRNYERVLLCHWESVFDHEEVIVIKNYPIRRYGTKWAGHENVLNLCRDIDFPAQRKTRNHAQLRSLLCKYHS